MSNNSKVILKRKLQSSKGALQRKPQNQMGQEKENFVKLSLTKLMSVCFLMSVTTSEGTRDAGK